MLITSLPSLRQRLILHKQNFSKSNIVAECKSGGPFTWHLTKRNQILSVLFPEANPYKVPKHNRVEYKRCYGRRPANGVLTMGPLCPSVIRPRAGYRQLYLKPDPFFQGWKLWKNATWFRLLFWLCILNSNSFFNSTFELSSNSTFELPTLLLNF